MRASLDTNVIIHLYRANMQSILFDVFKNGVFIYEQILKVELEHHGKMVLKLVTEDIEAGKIELYTDERLKKQSIYKVFENNVKENRLLYGTGDLGEVYAISLAQTIGAYSMVTDDTKQGGPYMSLIQLNYDVKPFTFTDVLILRYLLGIANEHSTIADFKKVNETSELNWSFKSQFVKFIKRFVADPYKLEEKEWFEEWTEENSINAMGKFRSLRDLLKKDSLAKSRSI